MGNEPNICCDNTRHEVNWFDTEQHPKVKIVPAKSDRT